jgi:hypothetical protein
MTRCRKSHPLLFLALLVIAQSFFPPMASSADSPLLPWDLNDDPTVDGSRLARHQFSGNDDHIAGVRNVGLNHLSEKGHGQPLFEFGTAPGKKHLGKFFPSLHNLPVAQNITGRSPLQATMMKSVTPLVLLSEFLTMTTLTDKIVYLLFVLCYSLCIFSWLTGKHPDV